MGVDTRYFLFLRAINVGGRRVTNDQLIGPLLTLSSDVAAYQAAGNLTLRSNLAPAELSSQARGVLENSLGIDIPIFVRTEEALRPVVEANVYSHSELAKTAGKVQIGFLDGEPTQAAWSAAMDLVPTEDSVRIVGEHWFWLPEQDISESSLPVSRFEQTIGPTTLRTLGTVDRFLAKYSNK